MANTYGMHGYGHIQVQSALGASLVTSLNAFTYLNESIKVTRDQLVEGGVRNRFVENPYTHGKYTVGGQLTLEANPLVIGHFLLAAFGRASATSAAASQTVFFAPNCSDHSDRVAVRPVTLKLHRGDANSSYLYSDLVPNQLTFNFPQGQFMSMAVDFIGGNFAPAAPTTFTGPGPAPFRWDQTSIEWTGAAVVDVEDLTIRLNNMLEPQWVLVACATPYRFKRTAPYKFEVEGTMTFVTSVWDVFMSGSQGALTVNVAGVSPHRLFFQWPNFRFYDVTPTVAGPGLVRARFSGGGMYDVTSFQAGYVTLVTCSNIGIVLP